MEQLFEVKITATGEVRDADGNLISTAPYETTMTLTQAQLDEFQKNAPVAPTQGETS